MTDYTRRFSFRDWLTYREDQATGKRLAQFAATRPHENKYIYIFAQRTGQDPELVLEVFANNAGELELRTLRGETWSGRVGVNGRLLTLPRTLLGEPLRYYFFGIPIPLLPSSIQRVQEQLQELVPGVDLGNDNHFVFSDDAGASNESSALPVFDPLAIAEGFAIRLAAVHQRWLTFMTEPGHKEKFAVGSLLRPLLSDEKARESIEGDLKIEDMERELQELTDRSARLLGERDQAADQLSSWLSQPLIGLVEGCYVDQEEEYFAEFIAAIAGFVTRLQHAQSGQDLLAAWKDSDLHFIRNYVLPDKPLYQVADDTRKHVLQTGDTAEKIFEIWQAFPYGVRTPAAVDGHLDDMVRRFNNVFGGGVLGKPMIATREFDSGRRRLQPNESAIWAPWVTSASKLYERTKNVCTAIDGVLALGDLFGGGGSALGTTASAFSMISTGSEAVKSFGQLSTALGGTRLSGSALLALGGVAKMTTVFSDVLSGAEALQVDDRSKAAGHGLSIASVILWSAAGLVAAEVAGPLMIAGLLAGVGGGILTTFTADDPLQTFAKHCFWGSSHGSGSGDFAGTKLSQWRAQPELQLEALVHIIFGFTVAESHQLMTEGKGGIDIDYGACFEDTVIHVEWTTRYTDGDEATYRYEASPSARTVRKVAGGDHLPQKVLWGTSLAGRPRLSMEKPNPATGTFRQIEHARCGVWLLVDGEGKLREPFPDKKLVWAFWKHGQFSPDDDSHSTDV